MDLDRIVELHAATVNLRQIAAAFQADLAGRHRIFAGNQLKEYVFY
jgi:hypothetical protein